MSHTARIQEWAQRLLQAEAARQPVTPLTEEWPEVTAGEAYAIQRAIVAAKVERGARRIGYKLARTNPATRAPEETEPVVGILLDTMQVTAGEGRGGAVLARAELIAPLAEAELVFWLGEDLAGPGVTVPQVLAATRMVLPAIEIADSRFLRRTRHDVIADSASGGRILLGSRGLSPLAADWRLVGLVLERNGVVAGTAAGAGVMGHPAAAVAWLANHLAREGGRLRAGELIYSGSALAPLRVEAGDHIRAGFDHLGWVELILA